MPFSLPLTNNNNNKNRLHRDFTWHSIEHAFFAFNQRIHSKNSSCLTSTLFSCWFFWCSPFSVRLFFFSISFVSSAYRVETSSQLSSAPESNRNYYNATSNQEYNNPTQFNSYFSVYDDEAEDTGDLYRDGKWFDELQYSNGLWYHQYNYHWFAFFFSLNSRAYEI